ncbi:hypothetical protein [Saccharothrix sp. NRRL B-16348]|uniref:hypothetical protein n=1 Tax=Saccharothrix sp. NRRL B-16348 TaxID=1415542 RepID=UPI0018D1B125
MEAHADDDGAVEAALAWRCPPRLSRWLVMPEDAGNGATPQMRAQAGSDRTRVDVVAGDDAHFGGGVGVLPPAGNGAQVCLVAAVTVPGRRLAQQRIHDARSLQLSIPNSAFLAPTRGG